MKIHCKYTGIKGFLTVYNRAVKFRYMITETAKRRLKILEHCKRYGLGSTLNAFDVSERTLWYWKTRLNKGEGKIEALNPGRRTPANKKAKNLGYPQKISHLGKIKKANRLIFLPEPPSPLLPSHKRVHWAFKNKLTPLEVLTKSDYYVSKLPVECKNGWGYSVFSLKKRKRV